jgi:hypothetical protein
MLIRAVQMNQAGGMNQLGQKTSKDLCYRRIWSREGRNPVEEEESRYNSWPGVVLGYYK